MRTEKSPRKVSSRDQPSQQAGKRSESEPARLARGTFSPLWLRDGEAARLQFLAQLFQSYLHVGHCLPAAFRILFQTPADDPVELRWNIRNGLRNRLRLLVKDRRKRGQLGCTCERLPPGNHFVEHRTEREDIRARIWLLGLDLLW